MADKDKLLKERINLIKSAFEFSEAKWIEPFETTEGNIVNQKIDTKIKGMYYFYENNFYLGISSKGTIYERHKTHKPKFDVNLHLLWKNHWDFSKVWQEGVKKFYLEKDPGPIPFIKRKNKNHRPYPEGFEFHVIHKINTDNIKVLIWNMDHLPPWQIEMIEKIAIYKLWLYCNDETSSRRKYENRHL